jgi:hypothetical protein
MHSDPFEGLESTGQSWVYFTEARPSYRFLDFGPKLQANKREQDNHTVQVATKGQAGLTSTANFRAFEPESLVVDARAGLSPGAHVLVAGEHEQSG